MSIKSPIFAMSYLMKCHLSDFVKFSMNNDISFIFYISDRQQVIAESKKRLKQLQT